MAAQPAGVSTTPSSVVSSANWLRSSSPFPTSQLGDPSQSMVLIYAIEVAPSSHPQNDRCVHSGDSGTAPGTEGAGLPGSPRAPLAPGPASCLHQTPDSGEEGGAGNGTKKHAGNYSEAASNYFSKARKRSEPGGEQGLKTTPGLSSERVLKAGKSGQGSGFLRGEVGRAGCEDACGRRGR